MSPCHPTAAGEGFPRWEVADVFRRYGEDYRRVHPLSPDQARVMRAITSCRTSALGGHLHRCEACGYERLSYNSCRNRHCPKCQSMAQAKWLEARRSELLPVGYYHAVFTLPHALNPLVLYNRKVLFDALLTSVAATLQAFGQDPKHGLGGQLGLTALLHTWDQQLRFHVHVHCLIAGGALCDQAARWARPPHRFLFPVKALGKVFRGKYLACLEQAFAHQTIHWPPPPDALEPEERFRTLRKALYQKPWVVYLKKPFAGPETVLDYLGRYTHRIALSNHRLLKVADGSVSFSWRDRAEGHVQKSLTLPAEEFIRRFLLHVVPKGFVRCRHYGFLAPRAKAQALAGARRLLGLSPEPPVVAPRSARERLEALTGVDLSRCPHCRQGLLRVVAELPALGMIAHRPPLQDTS